MKKVYKYELTIHAGVLKMMLPKGTQILHYGHQGDPNIICIWALVDIHEKGQVEYSFHVVGTGHQIDGWENWSWVATVNYHPVPLVWHIFTLLELPEAYRP